MRHACQKTFRRRDHSAAPQGQRVERGKWEVAPNKVVIDLNTHSVKGISDYDFVLAEKINEIFEPFAPAHLSGSGKGQ